MMRRSAPLLFIGLGVGGAIIGAILGEVLLTRGSGVYVAPVMGVIGLLLAWMLWATPRPTEPPLDPPPVMPHDSPKTQARTMHVNVKSPATMREKRGGRSNRR